MDQRVIAIWVLLLSAILVLASLQTLESRDRIFLACFAIVAFAWTFVVVEQLSPAPAFAQRLTPSIWEETSDLLGQKLTGVVSMTRNQPYFSAGSGIACMLSMVCGFLVGRNRHAAHLLMMTFAGSALIYAIYGILGLNFWPNYLLWRERFNYPNSLITTFLNPNVTAVYFGAAAIVWVLVSARMARAHAADHPTGWCRLIGEGFRPGAQRIALCFVAMFAVLSATFMTGSRAGSVLSLLAIFGAVATFFRRKLGPRGLIVGFPVFAACAMIVALEIFATRVNERFGLEGLFDAGRWNTYLSTLEIIKQHPWLGTGLGTFRWVFPAYRTGNGTIPAYGTWEQAHNTALEIASEMGIPFTTLIIAGWLGVFIVLGRGMIARRRDEILPAAAFWIGLLAVLHSLVDFSLQIPGFSLAILPLIGMGLAQSKSSRPRI
jgi:O-antigen ligase